jgi:hypothetical protein
MAKKAAGRVPPPDDDDFDEEESRPQEPDGEPARLRRAWVAAVRRMHERNSGRPSGYKSQPRWDGGTDSAGRFYQPVWPRLVSAALAAGVDPAELVDTLFETWPSDTAPLPTMLVSPDNLRAHQRRQTKRRAFVQAAAPAEEAAWRSAVWAVSQTQPDPEAVTRFVLNDLSVQVSPAFRYAMARAAGMTDLAARWRDQAVCQVARDLAYYKEFWNKLLPRDLTEDAARAGG